MAGAVWPRVRELVLAHGWNSTAYQILNPGLTYWLAAAGDAAAAYVPYRRWWVIAGAPVAPAERLAAAVAELEGAARAAGARVAYFHAEGRLEALLAGDPGRARLLLGAQPMFDPRAWPSHLARHASLRAQLARVRHKGVTVREWPSAAATEHSALRRCLEEWLTRRGLPPLEFLTTPWTLGRLADRRVFVAERHGAIVGFLVTSPVPARRLALVEQIVRATAAPNGTAELLIDAAFRALAGEVDWITLGLAPLAARPNRRATGGTGNDTDGGSVGEDGWREVPRWLRLLVSWAGAHGRRFYNFRGLEAFKAKLDPERWEPVWLIAAAPRITPGLLWATVAAFAAGRPSRFVARALARAASHELRRLRQGTRRSRAAPTPSPPSP